MSAFFFFCQRSVYVESAGLSSAAGEIRSEMEGAEKDMAAVIHLPGCHYPDVSLPLPFKMFLVFEMCPQVVVGNKCPTVLMLFNQTVLKVLDFCNAEIVLAAPAAGMHPPGSSSS